MITPATPREELDRRILRVRAAAALGAACLLASGGGDAAAETIRIDGAARHQTILGFGGQGHPGLLGYFGGPETLGELARDLNVRLVRTSVSVSFSQSDGPGFDGYLAKLRATRDQTSVWAFSKALNDLGAEPLFVIWTFPDWTKETWGALKDASLAEAVNLWTAIVAFAVEEGIRFRYVELINEPDGSWGTSISPTLYWQLVDQLSSEWDQRGLPVQIVGPGTAFLSSLDSYLQAMPAGVPSRFGMVSTHAWDDLSGPDAVAQPLADARSTLSSKGLDVRLIVTEYGTKHFGDADTYSDPSPTDDPAYALWVASMTHHFLSSDLTTSLLIWDLYDLYGYSGSTGTEKVWGLRRSPDRGFSARPHNFALQPFYRLIAPGATRVDASVENGPGGEILATAYSATSGLTSVLVNTGSAPRSVDFAGVPSGPASVTQWQTANGSTLVESVFAGGTLELPAESVTGIQWLAAGVPAAPGNLQVQ